MRQDVAGQHLLVFAIHDVTLSRCTIFMLCTQHNTQLEHEDANSVYSKRSLSASPSLCLSLCASLFCASPYSSGSRCPQRHDIRQSFGSCSPVTSTCLAAFRLAAFPTATRTQVVPFCQHLLLGTLFVPHASCTNQQTNKHLWQEQFDSATKIAFC